MKNTRNYKICFLGYSRLYSLANEVVASLPPSDISYLVIDCDLDTQDEYVQEAIRAGCEVFIAGPGNGASFQAHYNFPLVEIQLQPLDYILAAFRAKEAGYRAIAVSRFRYSRSVDIQAMEQLLGVPITEYVYETMHELDFQVRHSLCDAFVGTAGAVQAAEAAGKAGFLVYTGTEAIRDACLRAAELAREIWETRKSDEITKAVMNNAQMGIIITDPDGNIQYFNRIMQRYTGLLSVQVRGNRLDEYLPNLAVSRFLKAEQNTLDSYRLIGETMMRCVQKRVLLRGETVAVLTTLFPQAHNLRKKEREKPKGFSTHIYHWEELTANSKAMAQLVAQGKTLSGREYPTLILGEPGAGQEEIAYCIHGGSARSRFPCITLDLATIPEQDAPHVLFGFERGERTVNGLLADANGGSVVLKNIALAKPSALACLQQILNGQQIFRPGMENALTLDLFFFTVANYGELDIIPPDLAAQLSVQKLEVPPLRSRKEDVAPLFLKNLSTLSDTFTRFNLTGEMEILLQKYSWPGNAWELRTVSTRYMLARGESTHLTARSRYLMLLQAIGEDAVFQDLVRQHPILSQRPIEDKSAFLAAAEEVKDLMHLSYDVLAARLGLSRTTLWRLMRQKDQEGENEV